MATGSLMKDGLGGAAVDRIALSLRRVMPDFNQGSFVQQATSGLDKLELRDRVNHLISVLHSHFPANFDETAAILLNLRNNWEPGDKEDKLSGFAAWPLIDYVGVHGLDHPAESLQTLFGLTGMFSAEFAIRPFLIKHTAFTLEQLHRVIDSPDYHVRRLISEGTRPRLPWGQRLPAFVRDPEPVLELLELLKDDETEYVRRSVGNNMNDISKDHPETVVQRCSKWLENGEAERMRTVKRATRTLVKQGYPAVWPLLGYASDPEVKVSGMVLDKSRLGIGEDILFSARLESTANHSQKLEIDYALHFIKSNGRLSPKVFKIKTINLKPKGVEQIKKKQSFKIVTTRKLYPGRHAVEILVNGKSCAKQYFELME